MKYPQRKHVLRAVYDKYGNDAAKAANGLFETPVTEGTLRSWLSTWKYDRQRFTDGELAIVTADGRQIEREDK